MQSPRKVTVYVERITSFSLSFSRTQIGDAVTITARDHSHSSAAQKSEIIRYDVQMFDVRSETDR